MVRLLFSCCLISFIASCGTGGSRIFNKKTPHEQYGNKLEEAGLKDTELGRRWFEAAAAALSRPVLVKLPHSQRGYFSAENPRAVGLQFDAVRGEKLFIRVNIKSAGKIKVYTDLYKVNPGERHDLLTSMDTSDHLITHEVEVNGKYHLRLQPELLRSGEYQLTISVGAQMAFPVAGKTGRVGSIWGDARDAGARQHEGIDIFAPRRTPVIAIADGLVTRVNENNLGGKVVWVRPSGKNLSLYYAHLDEQLVRDGQRVRVGDTLGLVGNTGNARNTPPHLHFGIYAMGGAIDPYPFVRQGTKEPPDVTIPTSDLNDLYRITKDIKLEGAILSKNTVLHVTDASASYFLAHSAEKRSFYIPRTSLTKANQLSRLTIKDSMELRESPFANAPVKRVVQKNEAVSVLGYYKDYTLVRVEEDEGWLPTTQGNRKP